MLIFFLSLSTLRYCLPKKRAKGEINKSEARAMKLLIFSKGDERAKKATRDTVKTKAMIGVSISEIPKRRR